jgi:hypothetical protein
MGTIRSLEQSTPALMTAGIHVSWSPLEEIFTRTDTATKDDLCSQLAVDSLGNTCAWISNGNGHDGSDHVISRVKVDASGLVR